MKENALIGHAGTNAVAMKGPDADRAVTVPIAVAAAAHARQSAKVRLRRGARPDALTMIARQIKASGRAYPLFGTARLFLERPERHRVRFTTLDANRALFQLDDGPIAFDRAAAERNAFHQLRDDFYRQEVTVGEPLKRNFSNVARCRSTGTLLGPSNYHAYQPALRKLYEERF